VSGVGSTEPPGSAGAGFAGAGAGERGSSLEEVLPQVAAIVADVRERGDDALLDWTERLDGERPQLAVPAERLRAARLPADARTALRALAAAVAAFCAPQRPPDVDVEAVRGIRAERRWLPLSSVGIYVPGGRATLPSSLVMAAVPARLAGVERIVVVTPRPREAALAAARELGIDEIYAVGGAQAVAALAYGTETIRPVDKIVGPGSRWVTAAKLLVSSRVGIDLPAGPSEVVAIADAAAEPERVAASLLAQAEHGPDSAATLLALDPELAARVAALVDGAGNVEIRVLPALEEALALSEAYAPEHLELWLDRAEEVAPQIRNAGTVFVRTSAVVGDYASGATHILPTGGLARGSGGIGLETFLKPVQVVAATAQGLERARAIGLPLARLEGLDRHAAALELA
jgi:histidinol dehydrogenase